MEQCRDGYLAGSGVRGLQRKSNNDANITNLSATTLDISEGINSEGLIKANEGEFLSVVLGDIKIQNNIISLSDESILDEIILNANKMLLVLFHIRIFIQNNSNKIMMYYNRIN